MKKHRGQIKTQRSKAIHGMPDPSAFVLFSLNYSRSWLQEISISNPGTVTVDD